MPFEFTKLKLSDVTLIKPKIYVDDRGFFLETFKESEFHKYGIIEQFVQDNHSRSSKGVLRGLHYQLDPFAQGKLVRCIRGEIFDVAVDIRKKSPTFSQWLGVYLNPEEHHMLYIPPGFAHGFYNMQQNTEVIYKVTVDYAPEYDRGIIWNDPEINIQWPSQDVVLSEKDSLLPRLANAEVFE
jgi:dTDP-4-dehydrorhamnose 3,5-epimerase